MSYYFPARGRSYSNPNYEDHGCRGPSYAGRTQQRPFQRAYYNARVAEPYGNNLPWADYAQPARGGRGLSLDIDRVPRLNRTYGSKYSTMPEIGGFDSIYSDYGGQRASFRQ